MTDRDPDRLPTWLKLRLAAAAWTSLAIVALELRRNPLPVAARRLAPASRRRPPIDDRRLGRIVMQVLWVGPFRPRCLYTALVLYRLLHQQGVAAELVIGLPVEPTTKDAHAWVEVGGRDVGPPPGRNGHDELARYVAGR